MLNFFKYVFATVTGIVLFFLFGIILLLLVVNVLIPDSEEALADKPVLRIILNKTITERESDDIFAQFTSPFSSRESGTIGLMELRKAIKKAEINDNIKGILLDIRMFNAGFAQIEELRDDLLKFKESGKFLYAYSESYSEKGYYLASIADKIFLVPNGDLEFNGLSAEVLFFTGLLEKLKLEPVIFRVGAFKSAVEVFTEKEMSEPSREQMKALLNSLFDNYLNKVSEARGIKYAELKNIADSMLVRRAGDAERYKLITHQAYFDSLETIIRNETGLEEGKKIEYAKYHDLYDNLEGNENSANKVAVIVAEGTIEMGSGEANTIGSDAFTEEIRKVRLDDDVKSVVIRINSPGGSALASDVIWREIELTSRVKPVIASMSDVAASGGYYIAAGCDTIVAHSTTITGSIGVFGLMLTGDEFLRDNFGITSDRVKTSPLADIGSFTRDMTDRERQIIQRDVENTYEDFLQVVAKGRGLDKDYVHTIAQGRVWAGKEAIAKKLVDVEGGLDVAIKLAAQKAGIAEDYSVTYLPEVKDIFLRELLSVFLDEKEEDMQATYLGKFAPYIKSLQEVNKLEGVQTRLPYKLVIH